MVAVLARESGHPLVSGGDRHGCKPNANLNLTNAGTFEEFLSEVREDRMSDIAFMPQFRERLVLRRLETAWDIIRDYPEYTGRARWTDRIFYYSRDGAVQPVAALFENGGPGLVNSFLSVMRVFHSPRVQSALRGFLAKRQELTL
jgi:hypothetical protein